MLINQKELLFKLARGESLTGVEIGDVDFSGYAFKKKMGFERAQFVGKTVFHKVQFLEGAYFTRAQFAGKGGVNFLKTQFSGERGAYFSEAQFSGEGEFGFEGTMFGEGCPINFSRVKITNPQNLRFVDVKNLGDFSFLYTDVENIVFKNVTFRKTKNQVFKRELIADEIWNEIAKEEDKVEYGSTHFNQVEILYRQLKRNFEDQRDYARAGDFHYGEMKMKCKQLPRWRQFASLNFLYKVISGYGQKWYQGLISFLVLALLFSIPNMYWIHPPKETLAQYEMGEANSCLAGYEICPEVYWPQTFLFTLKVMTLNKSLNYELKKAIWLGGFAVFLQYLIGPTVIALMVLAIRRQFRR